MALAQGQSKNEAACGLPDPSQNEEATPQPLALPPDPKHVVGRAPVVLRVKHEVVVQAEADQAMAP